MTYHNDCGNNNQANYNDKCMYTCICNRLIYYPFKNTPEMRVMYAKVSNIYSATHSHPHTHTNYTTPSQSNLCQLNRIINSKCNAKIFYIYKKKNLNIWIYESIYGKMEKIVFLELIEI